MAGGIINPTTWVGGAERWFWANGLLVLLGKVSGGLTPSIILEEHAMYDGNFQEIKEDFVGRIGEVRECYNNSHVMKHIDWHLAINVGVLLWLIGMIDTFTISEKLAFKWLFISVCVGFLVSLAWLFKLRVYIMKLEMGVILWLLQSRQASNIEEVQEPEDLNKCLANAPSLKAAGLANVCLLLAFVLLFVYILLFVIVHR